MEIAVRYQSRGGNTKKLAEAIAAAAGVAAKPVDTKLDQPADLLFVGGAVYAAGIDPALRTFLESLTPETVRAAAVFSTAAIKTSAFPQIKEILEAKGIRVLPIDFHTRGQFAIVHRGHPNADDLAAATKFARETIATTEKEHAK